MTVNISALSKLATEQVPKDQYAVTEWITHYNQQFARLIVNECISIAENHAKNLAPVAGLAASQEELVIAVHEIVEEIRRQFAHEQ